MGIGEVLEATDLVNLDALEYSPLSALVALVYVAYLVSFLASIAIVSMWIYRAHANLEAAGLQDLEFSPGWSVGWFFVPIMNLFKPFQAMRELWNTSHGASNNFGEESPPSVKAWWACYIIGNILSSVGTRLEGHPSEVGISSGLLIGAVGSAFIAASAWFLLQVVREVMEAQRGHLNLNYAFA